MTPSGIESATFRLVAQCLNQLRPPRTLLEYFGYLQQFKPTNAHGSVRVSQQQCYGKPLTLTCFGVYWSIIRVTSVYSNTTVRTSDLEITPLWCWDCRKDVNKWRWQNAEFCGIQAGCLLAYGSGF